MSAPSSIELLIGLTNVVGKVQRQLGGALSIHGIGFTEYLVLWHLQQAPEQKMRRIDLAECVGLTASGVTRLVNPMEKIGLLAKESSARDARVIFVALTEAGLRVFEESNDSVSRVSDRLVGSFGAENQRLLNALATHATS